MNLITAIEANVKHALDEDIGTGDVTAALILKEKQVIANIICRENAILCGMQWLETCFQQFSANTSIKWLLKDGEMMTAGQKICTIKGNAQTLLSVERTALNFLQTLSAVATLTRSYVDTIAGTGVLIIDTRKTLPGLRAAQKYAVMCGGGTNHRFGLYDGVLLKENHIIAAGSIEQALKMARGSTSFDALIQVEVETINELRTALDNNANMVLLDNFNLDQLREAVSLSKQFVDKQIILEASGNITMSNVRAVAETGVSRISIGSLTKNIKAVDFSMQFSTV